MSRRGENIRKRKDGRWEGRYQIIDACSGKIKSRSVYAKTYAEVREKLSVIKNGHPAFDIPPDDLNMRESGVAFDKVSKEWLFNIEKEKKYATFVKYSTIYKTYIKSVIGNTPVNKITPQMINMIFLKAAGKSNSTLMSISCVINQIMKYAAAKYNVSACRAACGKSVHTHKPVMILSKSEQIKLMHYLHDVPDIYKTGIILCLSTGLRLGELCSLKWEDIDFENKLLRVNRTVQRISVQNQEGKTALVESEPKSCFSKREIPITDALINLLLPYYENDCYVLNGKKPMEPRTYQNKFSNYLISAGIRKTNFHTLRHTFATNCIDNGADIKSLSEILGHSDVKITLNRYVHPTMETKRQYMNTLAAIYGQYVGQNCV